MIALPQPIRHLLRPNPAWYGLVAGLALTVIGVTAIETVAPGDAWAQFSRWLPISLVAMALCMLPHPRSIGRMAYPLLAVALFLLIFVILPWVPYEIVPRIKGQRSWIRIAGFSLQPSELAKITFVLALAWYLRYRDSYRTLIGLMVPFLIMFVPVGLILKEPDLGQAMIFAPTLFAVLIAAGAKLRHLGALLVMGAVFLAANIAIILVDPPHDRAVGGPTQYMHFFATHQERRIAALVWPDRYAKTEAFQQIVGTRLMGTGGLTGVGEERARLLVNVHALPEPHNDMIFSVIGLRWGLSGLLVVLGLYLVIILSFVNVAARSKDPVARLACVGFAAMIFAQVAINAGMNVGLLPIVGITLPFVSYGGTSLLAMFCMLGLVLNFASRRPAPLARPSFEFDNTEAVFQ